MISARLSRAFCASRMRAVDAFLGKRNILNLHAPLSESSFDRTTRVDQIEPPNLALEPWVQAHVPTVIERVDAALSCQLDFGWSARARRHSPELKAPRAILLRWCVCPAMFACCAFVCQMFTRYMFTEDNSGVKVKLGKNR